MNKKTKIIILISACLLIVVIGIYFLFPKGNNNQNIYVQKVSTIIGSSYTENRYSGVVLPRHVHRGRPLAGGPQGQGRGLRSAGPGPHPLYLRGPARPRPLRPPHRGRVQEGVWS